VAKNRIETRLTLIVLAVTSNVSYAETFDLALKIAQAFAVRRV
jgi:hypothetical protein